MMMNTFTKLCKQLNLTSTYEHQSSLLNLEKWCYKHISQDIRYHGSDAERYLKYLTLASDYLNNFLPQIPENLAQKMPQYNHLNVIQYAAQQGYDRFISELPASSEKVINKGDKYDMTPLHYSAIKGFVFSMCALLAKGADPSKVNAQGQSPIHSTLMLPVSYDEGLIQRKIAIFRALKSPKLLTMKDGDGNTLLHLMAAGPFHELMAELLQDYQELVFWENNIFHYPIHIAILNRQQKVVDLLLAVKGVATKKDSRALVPLHYAACHGSLGIMESCCKVTDLDIRDDEERTPLLWAASVGNQSALELLIKKGADPLLTDYQGLSILHHAVIREDEAMVSWIVNNESLLLNQPDREGNSPLYYAQMASPIEKLLLSKGAINMENTNTSFSCR
ncbi:MAG: ankyrin repeat domain-containing protein [Legionella sp.]|uniref:ankyrin repeat domain-containing protein n=1 Tax=Legionella sp. TaxID=459 RepID=UPI0039E603DC